LPTVKPLNAPPSHVPPPLDRTAARPDHSDQVMHARTLSANPTPSKSSPPPPSTAPVPATSLRETARPPPHPCTPPAPLPRLTPTLYKILLGLTELTRDTSPITANRPLAAHTRKKSRQPATLDRASKPWPASCSRPPLPASFSPAPCPRRRRRRRGCSPSAATRGAGGSRRPARRPTTTGPPRTASTSAISSVSIDQARTSAAVLTFPHVMGLTFVRTCRWLADFRYEKNDSVLVVTRDDYKRCGADRPVLRLEGGEARFRLERSGFLYFISGAPGHCDAGQRFTVRVMAQRDNGPASPTEAPAMSPGGSFNSTPGAGSGSTRTPPRGNAGDGKASGAAPMRAPFGGYHAVGAALVVGTAVLVFA
uniref:Phytocyanin domain-containing protein n=1 Tax=Aegilops tauschii subsp. strangulata TaxID=200361 RepID=A0A453RCK2_AEGTS